MAGLGSYQAPNAGQTLKAAPGSLCASGKVIEIASLIG